MRSTVASGAVRTHQKTLRKTSDRPAVPDVKILTGSDPIRIDPNLTTKAEFLALVDEARIRAGLSQKEMAINACVPDGAFSEALSGTRGNFAIHWLDRQPASFWLAFNKITTDRYGLSAEREHDVWAERIGELVTLLLKQRRLG